MSSKLEISVGHYSDKGAKSRNEDRHGIRLTGDRLLRTKGVAAVIADGVSASERGEEAAAACVNGFLNDYFSTPESWSVQKSVEQVLNALNAWLYTQGQGLRDAHRGLISTLSAVVIKSTTAHLFHIGDSRIYRLRHTALEPLTTDHKTWLAGDRSCLSRAMGADLRLEIDYRRQTLEANDVFVFTTDGVHEYVKDREIRRILGEESVNLDKAAELICRAALDHGSQDNVTCQILRIDALPAQQAEEVYQELTELPFPPALQPGMVLEGYRVVRELHASKQTQLYLAEDLLSGLQVVLKTPSVNYEDDPAYLEQFILEEWVGRRIDHPNVMRVLTPAKPRRYLYCVAEYLEGRTLRQWLHDNPRVELEAARQIIEQLAKGLRAFHRLEMTHRDLKPENILIAANGTVKIIDFGSTRVAGIAEIAAPFARANLVGTRNYTAPEHLLEQPGDQRSDIYSLGTIAYEILTGQLPFGEMPEQWWQRQRAPAVTAYIPATTQVASLPPWIDRALRKAVHPDPQHRYLEVQEFIHDLRHPNSALASEQRPPLLERNPVFFWKLVVVFLVLCNALLIYLLRR
jgi:eukaryotic-like serine/threonine-protein kinase